MVVVKLPRRADYVSDLTFSTNPNWWMRNQFMLLLLLLLLFYSYCWRRKFPKSDGQGDVVDMFAIFIGISIDFVIVQIVEVTL